MKQVLAFLLTLQLFLVAKGQQSCWKECKSDADCIGMGGPCLNCKPGFGITRGNMCKSL